MLQLAGNPEDSRAGHLGPGRDPVIETDLLLALTGFTLLELGVIEPEDALAAVDRHLDRLFT